MSNKNLGTLFIIFFVATLIYVSTFYARLLFKYNGGPVFTPDTELVNPQTNPIPWNHLVPDSTLNLTILHANTDQMAFAEHMNEIKRVLSMVCPGFLYRNLPIDDETGRLSRTNCLPLLKRPWLVMGTAGTGTRVVHDILGFLGIRMSKLVNKQRDSRVFIELVKKQPFFSPMPSNIPPMFNSSSLLNLQTDKQTVINWIAENQVDFRYNSIDQELKKVALDAIDLMHKVISQEVYSKCIDRNVEWGFKEPQLMFMIPFINEYYAAHSMINISTQTSYNRVKFVHVVRDGRDISFSKQHLRKYQQLYNQILYNHLPNINLNSILRHAINIAFSSGFCIPVGDNAECVQPLHKRAYYESFLSEGLPLDWIFRARVARVWSAVNVMVKRYILASAKHSIYIPIQLETICDRNSAMKTFSRLLEEGNVEPSGVIVSFLGRLDFEVEAFESFIDSMDFEKCRLGKFIRDDLVLALFLEGVSYQGLQAFNYKLYGNNWESVAIQNNTLNKTPKILYSLLEDMPLEALEGQVSTQYVSIIIFVNHSYFDLFLNWLIFALEALKPQGNQQIFIIALVDNQELYETMMKTDSENSFHEIKSKFTQNVQIILHLLRVGSVSISGIWSVRLRAVQSLLSVGHTVIMSDADALFIKNPMALIQLPYDIIASRGRFPYPLASKWGAAVCMGWVAFQPSAMKIIDLANQLMLTMGDDQIVLNSVLDSLSIIWSPRIQNVGTEKFRILEGYTSEGDVALLDYDTVPRFCKDSEYHDAFILHCYTPKDGNMKKQWMIKNKLWKLDTLQSI